MKRFSEYVSLGHPDKIADYISSYILDRYLEKDPNVSYAVEVIIKDRHVFLAGEVSSTVNFTNEELQEFVKNAVREIGYTKEYQNKWGYTNTICADELEVTCLISAQSDEIAKGLKNGWGDQGIFFGYAEPNEKTCYMPLDHAIAKSLCKYLFESGECGLDIKTQVEMHDKKVSCVIVACPLLDENTDTIRKIVRRYLYKRYKLLPYSYKLIINGTGIYRCHSSIADCGVTGRKLAVDLYGGNERIGGGSPWAKDASKADVTLNLCARKFAMAYSRKYGVPVHVSLACCIGKNEVNANISDGAGNVFFEGKMNLYAKDIIEANELNKPIHASMCRWGLFGEFQKDKLWER